MLVGIAWTLFAAVLLGTFALPVKYVKNYKWENTWGSFFLFAMFVVPVGFSAIMLDGLGSKFRRVIETDVNNLYLGREVRTLPAGVVA